MSNDPEAVEVNEDAAYEAGEAHAKMKIEANLEALRGQWRDYRDLHQSLYGRDDPVGKAFDLCLGELFDALNADEIKF